MDFDLLGVSLAFEAWFCLSIRYDPKLAVLGRELVKGLNI